MEGRQIQDNRLEGSNPNSFSTMENMTEFHLYGMNIQGTLPPSLSTWSNITTFYVYYNPITGTLPNTYSTRQNIEDFDVEDNLMAGTLPPEYSLWMNIDEDDLYFDFNDFEGLLPVEYSVFMINTSHYISGNNRLCIEDEVLEYFQEQEGIDRSADSFGGVDLCD
eukprot:TRINITY_DN2919_c0_g1_i1.p1 TRINITY_DN2919_c0_g1~~TRINITY_DN2919_c0_g1_i1.p1  ORF type:complete len:165 (-),score=15.57 TRINITY_DN2919_c0_g1_i1:274-768(-)